MSPPIAIFAYNRPKHLGNLLDSLILNKSSKLSKIFIFCDGPKNEYDKRMIVEIKNLLKIKKIKIHHTNFRKKNIGLAKNIIKGVSKVLNIYKSCIILEDDLILNPNCIKFMNFMLKKFKKTKNIGSVSAHSYIDELKYKKKFNFYLTKRHSSWCWGTWSRVWKKIEWNSKNLNSHFTSYINLRKFSEGGNDLNLLLWGNYKKIINSWAIRFNFYCMKKSLKSIQPRFSMIRNEGRDFSGTHEKFNFKTKKIFDFNPKLGPLNYILKQTLENKELDLYIKNSHRRSVKLSIKYFMENFKII